MVKAYKKFLEWDIISSPTLTRVLEKMLAPVLGKSFIVYSKKPSGNA
jgi:hypothetical protein